MELNKWDKLAIGAVVIIVISVILTSLVPKIKLKFQKPSPFAIPSETNSYALQAPLPGDISEIAKKYKAFEDVFNTDKEVFLYGYRTMSFSSTTGKDFHSDMKKLLKKEDLNYKVIPLKNPHKIISKVKTDNGINPKTCVMSTPQTEKLERLFEVINNCMVYACIIDNANKKYVIIERDNPKHVIDVLKKFNPNKI